jgi:hypothetical protein
LRVWVRPPLRINANGGYEDKDEMDIGECLRMIKKNYLKHFISVIFLTDESFRWWDILDKGTKISPTWEKFEKLFSNKWIKDTKVEEMYRNQYELKEAKEEINKKGDDLYKIRDLNEALIKEVQKLK